MTNTANQPVPEQGKFSRALAAVFAWIEAMDYTNFDYTLDRIERLEREVARLKEELRQSRDAGPSMLIKVAPLGSNIDGPDE